MKSIGRLELEHCREIMSQLGVSLVEYFKYYLLKIQSAKSKLYIFIYISIYVFKLFTIKGFLSLLQIRKKLHIAGTVGLIGVCALNIK